MTPKERTEKIDDLEGRLWVRLPKSKWFRLLDHVDAPKERAPTDPVSDKTVRWVPIWVAAICEYGPGWAGISQLIAYVMDRDETYRLALAAQCISHPENVISFIRDTVQIEQSPDCQWVGEGAWDDTDALESDDDEQ